MSTLFAVTLSLHVIAGIVGVMASYAVVLFLLKKELPLRSLRISSMLAFLSYMLSWFSGGYYYVLYYGGTVKPTIVNGPYPWAHLVIMEAKEHIFIMLPFATLAVAAIVFFAGPRLQTDTALKGGTLVLAIVVSIIATAITLAGIVISGGAR